jgi:hypothetical protein
MDNFQVSMARRMPNGYSSPAVIRSQPPRDPYLAMADVLPWVETLR